MNDFSLSPWKKPKLIHRGISEYLVRVVSESAESFGAETPRKERILVTHSVSYGMDSHNTCALGEVLAAFGGMESRRFSDVRKLAGINVVDAPTILASETFGPYSARNQKR